MLIITTLFVEIEGKKLLENFSLVIEPGTVHVCMGPNGSGKSSLAYALLGHPLYRVTQGSIMFEGQDITGISTDKRARAGLFLSLQQPYEIPGVLLSTLLRESFRAMHPTLSLDIYLDRLADACNVLQFDRAFLDRPVHLGFSGGEKKRCEMLQLLVLQPKLAILDEIDSGLDVDALTLVGKALQKFKQLSPQSSLFIITHYKKILDHITPDFVHIMYKGKLIKSSDASLLVQVERHGFQSFIL